MYLYKVTYFFEGLRNQYYWTRATSVQAAITKVDAAYTGDEPSSVAVDLMNGVWVE